MWSPPSGKLTGEKNKKNLYKEKKVISLYHINIKIMKMTREQIIDKLVDNNIDTIISSSEIGDNEYLASILTNGFKGFDNYTDEELVQEYRETFNDDVVLSENDDTLHCLECGWEGGESELKTAMVDNEHNPTDKTLYETKVCPDCGKNNF